MVARVNCQINLVRWISIGRHRQTEIPFHQPLSEQATPLHLSTTSSLPRGEAMATSSPPCACAAPLLRRRLLPAPPRAPSPAAPPRLRLPLRRSPPPARAKFGKFEASDAAPTEASAEEAEWAAAAGDGAAEQKAEEDDRSGSLPPLAELVNNRRIVMRLYVCYLALCVSAACRRTWRARYGNRGRRAPISSTLVACEPLYVAHCSSAVLTVLHCFSLTLPVTKVVLFSPGSWNGMESLHVCMSVSKMLNVLILF